MKAFLRIIVYTIMSGCLVSCMNYYKISKSPPNNSTADTVIQANIQRYSILRNGDSAYHMSNIVLGEDKKSLTCALNTLPHEHKLHLTNGINGKMRFKIHKADSVVLDEMHIYILKDNTVSKGDNYSLDFNKIQKIEVLEKDKKRTRTSYWMAATAITLASTTLLIAVSVALSHSMFTGF